jgi:hypothetical protein
MNVSEPTEIVDATQARMVDPPSQPEPCIKVPCAHDRSRESDACLDDDARLLRVGSYWPARASDRQPSIPRVLALSWLSTKVRSHRDADTGVPEILRGKPVAAPRTAPQGRFHCEVAAPAIRTGPTNARCASNSRSSGVTVAAKQRWAAWITARMSVVSIGPG